MKRFSKLLVLALSLALVLGSMIGLSVTASATEGDAPTVSIAGKNMSYTGAVQVMYYVEATNANLETDVRLLVSDAAIDLENKANLSELDSSVSVKIYRGEATVNKGNGQVTYGIFFSDAIAPAELRKPIHAIPVVVDETGAIKATGTPSVYSPYQYAVNRFAADGVTAPQIALYKALLDYGAAVQAVLYDENEITTTLGGWADQYYAVTLNEAVNGVIKNEGELTYYRPNGILKAKNKLANNEVFSGFTLENSTTYLADENKSFVNLNLSCATLGDTPTAKVVVANYSTNTGVYETYSSLGNYQYSGNTMVTDMSKVTGAYSIVTDNAGDKALKIGTVKINGGGGCVRNMNFIDGETYVVDTDFIYNTNYLYNGTSNDYWTMKFYLSGSTSVSDNYEIVNLPFYAKNGETYSVGNTTLQLGEKYNLRYEFTPGSKYHVYIDGTLVASGNANSKKAAAVNLQSFCVAFRGSGSLPATDLVDGNITADITFDNTYVGTLSRNYSIVGQSNDFNDSSSVQGVGGAATVNYDNGNALLTMTNDKGYYFLPKYPVKNANANVIYVFEMDFTYNGGTLKEKTSDNSPGAGFIGFSWGENGGGDSYMYRYTTITLAGEADENNIMPYVTMYGQNYAKGQTVKIRYEFNPTLKTVRVYHNGTCVTQSATASTMTATNDATRVNTALYKGTAFGCFSIHFRGAKWSQVNTDCTFTVDNAYCGIITPETQKITVDYNNGGANEKEYFNIKYGETLTSLPANPTKNIKYNEQNYASTLKGWFNTYTEVKNGEAWAGYTGSTIKAEWYDYLPVTFETSGGTLSTANPVYVKYGETYTLPTVTKAGADFMGWYIDDSLVPQSGTWEYDEEVTLTARLLVAGTGRTGTSVFANQAATFSGVTASTLTATNGLHALTGTTTGSLADRDVTVAAKWHNILSSVGVNGEYLIVGHSGGSSLTANFKHITVENDTRYTTETFVYELDIMVNDAGYTKDSEGLYTEKSWCAKLLFNHSTASDYDVNRTITFNPETKKYTIDGFSGTFNAGEWYNIRIEISKGAENAVGSGKYNLAVSYYRNGVLVNTTPATISGKTYDQLGGLSINTRAKAQYVEIAVDNVYSALHKQAETNDAGSET